MIISLSLILIIGLIVGELLGLIRIPKFLGMIVTGVVLGPSLLNVIHPDILLISSDLRVIALVVILLRAGFSLDLNDLKEIGRPAILMSFIPAILEIMTVTFVAPLLFNITYLEAAILGSVLAAVSPAVIVPKMINLINGGFGENKKVPHLILGSASVDDIFVIVVFTTLLEIYETQTFNFIGFLLIPVAIMTGIGLGILVGFGLSILFEQLRVRDTVKVLIILAFSFLLIGGESYIEAYIPFSGLLSVMVLAMTFLQKSEVRALRLRLKFDTVWVFAELVLFVLIGAAVDIKVAFSVGVLALLMLAIQLFMRLLGVFLSLINTNFNKKEKAFIGVSYIPKATVQAAIGAIPLQYGLQSGNLILSLAVFSIMVTAPLGSLLIEFTYKKWLTKKEV